ncbi:MAG TPA: glycerophosphodiester phosphodiesterase family protein, partial [Kofleriaceae bacterium]|nr:glycerophosphodiester phosphodiesterase family protein [Kofleriaceae bacterium]
MHARRLYAHRGAAAERPENTLPSFERALEIGVDALEMDVNVTRDGQLIVVHDETAARTAGAPLAWSSLDLADAQRLDVGWGLVASDGTRPFAGKGIHVPRFADVLDAFRDVIINVDIKSDPRAAKLIVELVREHRAEDRVTIASFAQRQIAAVRALGYRGETALAQPEVASLLALPALLWKQLPFNGTAAQVPTHAGPLRFDRAAFIA